MRISALVGLAVSLSLTAPHGSSRRPAAPRVEIVATPGAGIQPQAIVDSSGTIHLIYFKGEPAGGDLYYVRRRSAETSFTAPIRVNSDDGSAIATGSVRGGQIALGRDGWIHVAWNAS